MTNVLNDIKEQNHDKKVCFTNCNRNAKVFNQIPHQCRFYSGSPRYKDLLEYYEIPTVDAVDGGTSSNPDIKDFCFQLIQLEDYKKDIKSGYRINDDIIEVENKVEEL